MRQWKNNTNGSLEFMKNNANILIYNITIYNMQKHKIGKHNHNDFVNSRRSNQFYFMNFGIMDKLEFLLNEYCSEEEIKWKRHFVPNHLEWEACDNSECSDLLIISKKYWFIKWLLANDKIDWLKARNAWYNKQNIWRGVVEDNLEHMIKFLSILDYSIDFLDSILK